MFTFAAVVSLWLTGLDTLPSYRDETEIALSSEAAPDHITDNASFMRFDGAKFVFIKKGSNNFTCLVVREPKGRFEPSCFNEQAMRSVFPSYQMHMRLLYAGNSYEGAFLQMKAAYEEGSLPTAETGALVYMMSSNNKFYAWKRDKLVSSPVHQMYFYPKLPNETFSLGKGSLFLWQGFPHMSALVVPVNP